MLVVVVVEVLVVVEVDVVVNVEVEVLVVVEVDVLLEVEVEVLVDEDVEVLVLVVVFEASLYRQQSKGQRSRTPYGSSLPRGQNCAMLPSVRLLVHSTEVSVNAPHSATYRHVSHNTGHSS